MKKIDYEKWDRREYYESFESFISTQFTITVEIDVTDFLKKVKTNGHSFYAAFVFVSTHAMNCITAFKYRKKGNDIYVVDKMDAGMAVMSEGDTAYRQIKVKICNDFNEFEKEYRDEVLMKKGIVLDNESDLIAYSTMPWVSFTGISPCPHGQIYDNMPLIINGKYFKREGRTLMPLAITFNHMFVQGNDVAEYIELLNKKIDEFQI